MRLLNFRFALYILCSCGLIAVFSCNRKTKVDQFFAFKNVIDCENMPVDSNYQITSQMPLEPLLMEASGIVPAHSAKGKFWMNEDSGCPPEIWVYNATGSRFGNFKLEGIEAFDYEELAYGVNPENGNCYLYLGDMGDNLFQRPYITIYRFEEPNLENRQAGFIDTIKNIESIILKYPNITANPNSNTAQDCEAFFVDPVTNDLILFTKNVSQCLVFMLKAPFETNKELNPVYWGELEIKGEKVTAADISPDGTKILLKTYNCLFLWERNVEVGIDMTLQHTPKKLYYEIEPQGESVCWALNESAFFLVSEKRLGIDPVIYRYELN